MSSATGRNKGQALCSERGIATFLDDQMRIGELAHRTDTELEAVRFIACFEALKGLAALAASVGLLSLVHHDVRALAYAFIGHFHLDPDAHYPRLLLNEASLLASSDLRQAVVLAWAYAAIRLLEGYGLWKDRAWAEWLATLSGSVYLPWELNHLVQHTTVINGIVLIGNFAVVAFMVVRLRRRSR
jgi:uncharacterized membrane protein (DUF2068 family)